jgi:hypothetical protein
MWLRPLDEKPLRKRGLFSYLTLDNANTLFLLDFSGREHYKNVTCGKMGACYITSSTERHMENDQIIYKTEKPVGNWRLFAGLILLFLVIC